jgi:CubicO group peptidase (beta-lactamase class C family)
MRGAVCVLVRGLLVALTLMVALPMAGLAQDPDETVLAARLDALAEGFMQREQVPGAIAVVVSGDTTILRGYGLADVEAEIPASADDTRFEIGSITKLFTWIAVMMLVEEGVIGLGDDITPILPEGLVPGDAPLTLAQLMSHRPGFEESFAIFDDAIASLPRVEALAAAAPEQVFPRGEVTSYSNWGVALAGNVVETLAGLPWEDFVETRILGPLGMEDTTTGEARHSNDQPPLSSSYRVQGGIAHPAFRIDIGAFAPAGGIASTAADMERFLRFLMSDGALGDTRLLRPETMAAMRTRLFDDRPDAADMAHGFQSRPFFGTTLYGHGGGLNEFLSNLVFVPEINAGVFISQNGGAGVSLPLLAPDLILSDLATDAGLAPQAPTPPPDAEERASEVAGLYLTNRRPFSGRAKVFGALGPLLVTPLPGGALILPTNTGPVPSRFEPIGPDLWQNAYGSRVAFLRDAEGRVVRMADGTGAQTWDRVSGLANPVWIAVTFGFAVLLSLTTLGGLIWRHGLAGGSRRGAVAAGMAAVSAIAVLAFLATGVAAALAATRLGSEFLFDQPQPTLSALFFTADAMVVLAGLLALTLALVVPAPGWGLIRKLHHGVFAVSLLAFGGMLLHWGLAFGGPI